MQKKLTILFAFAIFVLIVGWAITPVQAHKKDCPSPDPDHKGCNGGGRGGGGGGGDKYSVDVEFRDRNCDSDMGNRDHFCSDNRGLYDDADDGVSAVGDKFRFSLTLSDTSRQFFLDFSDREPVENPDGKPDNCFSVPDTCSVDATPELVGGTAGFTLGGAQNVFSTGEFTSLLDIDVNNSSYRNFWISFIDFAGDSWVVVFDPLQCNDTDVDLVKVKRTGEDTWEFEAINEFACLQRQVGGHGPKTLYGLYTVPFLFTVTLLP